MRVYVHDSGAALAEHAADAAARSLKDAIAATGGARCIAATGASQLAFLAALTSRRDIDWSKVELFHLDEYIGLSMSHPASFRRYLMERLIRPKGIARFHLLDGGGDPVAVCREAGDALKAAPIDVAFVGIGENGHLAFNDPPADFETEEAYIVVNLDEACRRQQLGEGWFATLEDVPRRAISMSVRQLLQARKIICVVPDARKARAVADCLAGDVSPIHPASVLRRHGDVTVYLDRDSAARLPREARGMTKDAGRGA